MKRGRVSISRQKAQWRKQDEGRAAPVSVARVLGDKVVKGSLKVSALAVPLNEET